jgi:DNA repair exonuclease SbcCD ATPase subunit
MADNLGMSQATHWIAGEQQKLMSRFGNWFRRTQQSQDGQPFNGENGEPPMFSSEGPELEPEHNDHQEPEQSEQDAIEPRTTFLRPWAKRDNAIDNLQRGIGSLSDLLVSLRDNMEKQSQRQEELLSHLSGLPEALRAIPENGRIQGEALQAIQGQIERQTSQQSKLGDVLDRLSSADSQNGRTLDALQQTITSLNDHDQAISFNLQSLGSALASMSGNTQASATVLEQLRDNNARRDGELERVIKRQNTRFTTLLTVAIVLSVGALTAVSTFGYLAYEALTKAR